MFSAAAESLSSVAFDRSISTRFLQLAAKLSNPVPKKQFDRERSIERRLDLQAFERWRGRRPGLLGRA
ncbi:hypothetical protein ACFX13_039365 [Malus domestica]